jgi:hypothetical protein
MDMIVPLCFARNLEETASIGNGFPDGSAIVDTEVEDNTIAEGFKFKNYCKSTKITTIIYLSYGKYT